MSLGICGFCLTCARDHRRPFPSPITSARRRQTQLLFAAQPATATCTTSTTHTPSYFRQRCTLLSQLILSPMPWAPRFQTRAVKQISQVYATTLPSTERTLPDSPLRMYDTAVATATHRNRTPIYFPGPIMTGSHGCLVRALLANQIAIFVKIAALRCCS